MITACIQTWTVNTLNTGIIPDIIVDAQHVIEYLKYAATRRLFARNGAQKKSENSRLSSVRYSVHYNTSWLTQVNLYCQSSLKKIMTMLGRVRRRQEDESPEISTTRPYSNSRTKDFYKAVMVQAQRLRLS